MGLAPVVGAFAFGFHDWPAFWSAGATVGTPDLVDPARHLAWQREQGLPEAYFAYPAGTAWLFGPFAVLPLDLSFVVHGIVMLGLIVAAGQVAGDLYGLDRRFATLALLAFGPVTASIVLGQNAPLGLLLALLATRGIVSGHVALTGVSIGLLLYKPTYALPLAGVLLLRRQFRELALVGLISVGWYLVGVAAAGGDVAWPLAWWDGVRAYLVADFAGNADKAVSIPGLLARLDPPSFVPVAAAVAIVAVSLPRLARGPALEAAGAALLVGVAASPHAWGYDAALAAPFLLWLLAGNGPLREPGRTPILGAMWAASLLWLVSRQTVVSAVAVVIIGALLIWWSGALRRGPEPPAP